MAAPGRNVRTHVGRQLPSRVLRRHPVHKDDFRLKRCSDSLRGRRVFMSTGSVKTLAVTLLFASTASAAEPLRTVHDATRNHTWVLQSDGVYLQGKRFELPGWIYAGEPYACGPDLAV